MLVSFLVSFLHLQAALAAPLGVDQYLEEVAGKNKAVRAARLTSDGSLERSREGQLLVFPTLFGDFHLSDDKSVTDAPSFQGDRTTFRAFQLGVSQLTTFGLEGKLSYNVTHTTIYDTVPGVVLQPDFFKAFPKFEFTQSLWRNYFGAGTRANQELIEAQALGLSFANSYQAKVELSNAEIAYWNLALAREIKGVARGTLERAGRIRDWQLRREKLGLGDKSDRLQSEAAYELRRLDLQSAEDDERTARRAFNASREQDSDEVPEELISPSAVDVANLREPARADLRDDVAAAGQTDRATEANAELSLQQLSPDVQIYGNFALTGRDVNSPATMSESFQDNHQMWLVGLRFTAPLDLPLILKSRHGHKAEKTGASSDYDHRVFTQETQWTELERKFSESKRRLVLSRTIEVTQAEKLTNEKDRFQKGRTTTYQVLTFEQDYAAAALTRIHAEGDVLRIGAQMRTYSK